MSCKRVQDQLLLLAYDELPAAERAACEAHLQGCAACRAAWEQQQAVSALLDQVSRQHVDVDLAAVCLRLARAQADTAAPLEPPQAARRGRWALVAAAGLAAAAIVAVAGWWIDVRVEPGHLVVAWADAAPTPAAPHEGPAAPIAAALANSGTAVPAAPQAAAPEVKVARAPDSEEIATSLALAALMDDAAPRSGAVDQRLWRLWPSLRAAQAVLPAAAQADGAQGASLGELRQRWMDQESAAPRRALPPPG
jgi:hypothetical protein